VKEARNHLARLGLRSRIGGGMPSACFPPNAVLTQEPLAGSTADRGSVVRLAVNRPVPWQCGLGLPPASPELQRIADRFVDFARNAQAAGATGLPADAPVDLFIGGRFVKRLTSEQQEHRRHWQGCPREIGYAGRSCPVSVLEPFLESPGAIARTSQEPRHACAHPRALPERLGAYRQVTLTADEMRGCASYFAIQLFVNDLGQIVAVNLVLSEP
jgi:hypothetical protein